jgi:hypothetical protein
MTASLYGSKLGMLIEVALWQSDNGLCLWKGEIKVEYGDENYGDAMVDG